MDTIVHGLFTPIASLPVTVSALAMMGLHTLVHLPVPSTSGHAVLTLPVLVPLSDLIGLSRQVTVLAYQYGAGLANMLWPTNGALMAMLAAAGVSFDAWLRFAVPVLLGLFVLAAVARGGRGGRGVTRLSSDQADQPLQRLQVGDADMAAPLLPVLEGDQGGNPPDAEPGTQLRVGVGVELEHQHLTGVPLGEVVQRRRHHPAGAAPVGVEVHQDRGSGALDGLIEVLVGGLDRPVQPDGAPAVAALGPGRQPGQVDPVGGVTEDARHHDGAGGHVSSIVAA